MSRYIYLIIVVLFSILGMKALLHPGLFTAHDIWHQVVRFYYYSQAVRDGQFPAYWVGQLANGFGYPLFIFSYQFPWMIGVLLLKMGFDLSSSIKILFFLSYLGSGIGMYFFVSNLLSNRLAALLSSILYLWLPYHFLIVYVGASMGSAFVFTFLPLVFLGINLTDKKPLFGISLFAIAISGVILSQVMHMAFLLPAILIFIAWKIHNASSKVLVIRNIIFSSLLAILVCSYYIIPASLYKGDTRFHTENGIGKIYERNFVNFKQLVYSKWGFSPIENNAKNGEISFQLGFAQWGSIILLSLLIILNKVPKKYKTLSIYLLVGFIVSILFTLDISKPIWKFVVNYAAIDFPFRFILPAAFLASICAGVILVTLNRTTKYVVFILLFSLAIYANRNHINVNQYTDFPLSTYLSIITEITTNTYHEYLPIKAASKLFDKPWNEVVGENLTVTNVKQKTNALTFDVSAPKDQIVSVGQFYFPGQILYLDNQVKQFNMDKEGRISFNLPSGSHSVKVGYQETFLMKFSKYLSLVGLSILTLIVLLHKKQYFHRKS